MDEENTTTGNNDIRDTKGLQEEGIDIIAGTGSDESEYVVPEEKGAELSPVFPEDASQISDSSMVDMAEKDMLEKNPTSNEPVATKKPEEVKPVEKAPEKIISTPIPVSMPKPKIFDDFGGEVGEAHNDPSIKPLRTYKTDTEEAIQNQHFSVASIAVAASKKRESTQIEYDDEKKSGPWLAIISSLIFLLLGSGGLYYVYSIKTKTETPPVPKSTLVSILKSDKQIEMPVGQSKEILSDFSKQVDGISATVGNIIYIYPTADISGTKTLLTAQEFFIKTGVTMPSRLLRSLSDQFMLGAYVFDGNTPFIILKNTFYQNAYSGMLEWEKNMRDDLVSLIPKNLQGQIMGSSFEDSVVKNKDIRTLRTNTGEVAIAYVFIDQNTILITTNQKALEELIDKMTVTRIVQ